MVLYCVVPCPGRLATSYRLPERDGLVDAADVAAVDADGGAADVVGVRASEVGNGGGDLLVRADRADIARALHSAARGLSVMDPAVQATLVAAAGASGTPHAGETCDLPDGLTAREAEILALIARGMTNPEIAAALVLSNHTVKSHINRIFAKTRSRDRAAATQYAQARNLSWG